MLRLRWFDAWRMHNLSIQEKQTIKNEWLYDGIIDTRACDTAMWFIWHWDSIDTWIYSGYHLPSGPNDCWIDLTYWAANIYAWDISISPLWDSDLYRSKRDHQINPYMKIMVINWVYSPAISNNITMIKSINDFKVPLETTINMKDFYRWYSQ